MIKKILSLSLLFALYACQSSDANLAPISAQEAHQLISQSPQLVILDVRTPEEYDAGHIEEAQNIDFNGDAFDDQIKTLDPNSNYLVYCAVGGRSAQSIEKMKAAGFQHVYDMQGGISAWEAASLPTIK